MQQHSQLVNRHSHTSNQRKFQFFRERVKCGFLFLFLYHNYFAQAILEKKQVLQFNVKIINILAISQEAHQQHFKKNILFKHAFIHRYLDPTCVMFLPVNMPLTIAKEKTTRNFQTHFHADSSMLHWISFLYLPHQRFHSSATALGKEGGFRIAH